MICFRSFLKAIQSSNDKQDDALNEKQTKKSDFDCKLFNGDECSDEKSCLKNSKKSKKSKKLINCSDDDLMNKKTKNDLKKKSKKISKQQQQLNLYSTKANGCDFEKQSNENQSPNSCDNAIFNLSKLFWIKKSLVLDPFPDFTSNTVLVVNRQYKKLFKLVIYNYLTNSLSTNHFN